jgi:hypothetical protein
MFFQGRNGGEPIMITNAELPNSWPMPNGVRRPVGILYTVINAYYEHNEKAGICGFVKKAAGRGQPPWESVKNNEGQQAKGQMEHPNARGRRPKKETSKPDAGSVTKHGYQ